MSACTFVIEIYCMTGWDDNEETGELEVDTFSDVLRVNNVINAIKNSRGLGLPMNEKQQVVLEDYEEIKNEIEVPSGDEISSLIEVVGIIGRLKSSDGVHVELRLNDNSGVSSSHRVDGEKYESVYKEKMREARKLATEIMKL